MAKRRARGSDLAQGAGQVRGAEAGHTEVGEDAIGSMGGRHFQRRFPALRLEHGAALRFQQHRGNGEADRIVIDGEDAAWTGFHDGTIVHSEPSGFTANAGF